jgi:hypothetical protein
MKQIILLIIGAALFAQSVQADDSCQSFRFSGEVREGEAFRQVIGAEASFFVDPSGSPGGGWSFEIGPTSSGQIEGYGYIRLVTPPYRGLHITMIYPTYAMAAQYIVTKNDRDFWFLFTRQDAEKARAAVDQLVSSGSTQSLEESLAQLAALPMGRGIFRIVDSDIIPGTAKENEPISAELLKHGYPDRATIEVLYGVVKRIVFEVELVVPPDYAIPKRFHSRPANCPEPWAKQWPTLQRK